jgi:tartrate-resistant acid phosphatase type 5
MKVVLSFLRTISLAIVVREVCADDGNEPLQFLALGDWGKGGSSGDILAVSAENLVVNKGVGIMSNTVASKVNNRLLRGSDNGGENQENHGDEEHGGNEEHNNHEGGKHGQEYTYQVAVAGGMASYINSSDINTSFIIALGDNFYDDGVLSSNDSMWSTHWEQVYLQNYSNMRIPWYPVFGNHDYGYGDVGAAAQLERAESDRGEEPIGGNRSISAGIWQFDSYNYSKCMTLPGTENESICIIFIDTVTLAPSSERHCNEEGGISTETQAIRIADQQKHIELMLLDAVNSTWVIVCGHYPIYTSGEHGDSSELISNLQPLLEQYNVSMYLAGHDHLSGHLQHKGIEYLIAGGGAMVDPLGDVSSVATDVWYGVGYAAFSVVQVTSSTLEIKFIHWNGTEMYNYTLHNPRGKITFEDSSTNVLSGEPSVGPTLAPSVIRTSTPTSSANPPTKSSHFVVPEISPPLLYLAVAAGSITGLFLSITFFTFGRRFKGKQKVRRDKLKSGRRTKDYTSLPETPRKDLTDAPSPYSTSPSPRYSTPLMYSPQQKSLNLQPFTVNIRNQSPPSPDDGNQRLSTDNGQNPTRTTGRRRRLSPRMNPFEGSKRNLRGDTLMNKLCAASGYDQIQSDKLKDHRKTKSHAHTTTYSK